MKITEAARRRAADVGDVLLALLLTVSAQIEVWDSGGSLWLRTAAAALMFPATAAVAVRRRWPFGAALTVVAFVLVAGVTVPGHQASFQPFIAEIVVVYTAAAYGSRRQGILVAAAGVASVAAYHLAQLARDEEIAEFPGVYLPLGIAYLLGRLREYQVVERTRLRQQAADLEHERDERARQAVAEERARMARELHDIVGHAISLIVVQARAGRRGLAADGDPAPKESLDAIESTGRQALGEMRRLVGLLRTEGGAHLSPQPGLAQLDDLVAQFETAGLDVNLRVQGSADAQLESGVELAAYRIVQEALTNALKHGGPGHADVHVDYGKHELAVEVLDAGNGVQTGDSGGHGLVGMRERVSLYGGELEAGEQPGGGFLVRARLPLTWGAA